MFALYTHNLLSHVNPYSRLLEKIGEQSLINIDRDEAMKAIFGRDWDMKWTR